MSLSVNLPKNLPYLPGHTYADPKITRYHKSQLLGLKDGIITGKLLTKEVNKFKFRKNNCYSRTNQ